MNTKKNDFISQQIIDNTVEWAIMHGVAFKQSDNTARHSPFSFSPITMKRGDYEFLLKVTPLITKLISHISEDHDFLQVTLNNMAKADPFFGRLMSLHQKVHGDANNRRFPKRQPLLLMRTDFMDDRQHGAKVIEFNGIAAGMAPFGQRTTELHAFLHDQWPDTYQTWLENDSATLIENKGLEQFAKAIAVTARKIHKELNQTDQPTFLMVVQKDEDNVYDQHLLEIELQKLGIRTVRRTFEQLSYQLSTGEHQSLMLTDVGMIDVVYLRAGYQYSDYYMPDLEEQVCCDTLSQTRLFIEQHYVAVNATISQQLATSKSLQMALTMMPDSEYMRWGLNHKEAKLIKSVLADMKPINPEIMKWFNTSANKQEWVLKNQGEGGGHCLFGNEISHKLNQLSPKEYDAWSLMLRLYPHEREKSAITVRDGQQILVNDLVSEIGLFTAYFNHEPITPDGGYVGYLIRSKPAMENEGGIHSGKGVLDSLTLV